MATNDCTKSVLAFKISTFMIGDRHEQVSMDGQAGAPFYTLKNLDCEMLSTGLVVQTMPHL